MGNQTAPWPTEPKMFARKIKLNVCDTADMSTSTSRTKTEIKSTRRIAAA